MPLGLIIFFSGLCFCIAAYLLIACWPDPDRSVRLHIASLHYEPKTKLNTMTTNLRSPVSQFAQLLLEPRDANQKRVKLDPDAIIAPAPVGTGARTSIQVLDRENGDRDFLVNLIPGDEPGEYVFTIQGDAEPGEGTDILEETFIYTATPNNAVTLGASVQYLPKTSLPA